MKTLPWRTSGARLELPRDLDVAYAIGRMGIATAYDIWPLFWGSLDRARASLRRLVQLRILRTFTRIDRTQPAWYALSSHAVGWVADESCCSEKDLRVVTGIRRTNFASVGVRNRFWVSLVLACRKTQGARVVLFRPEWELRAICAAHVHVVPDAMVVLADGSDGGMSAAVSMIEFDSGAERLATWEAKAKAYARLRGGPLYGAARWKVVALVPSVRRARGVAEAVVRAGADGLVFVGVGETLQHGRALESVLWTASALAANSAAAPTEALSAGQRIVLANRSLANPSSD